MKKFSIVLWSQLIFSGAWAVNCYASDPRKIPSSTEGVPPSVVTYTVVVHREVLSVGEMVFKQLPNGSETTREIKYGGVKASIQKEIHKPVLSYDGYRGKEYYGSEFEVDFATVANIDCDQDQRNSWYNRYFNILCKGAGFEISAPRSEKESGSGYIKLPDGKKLSLYCTNAGG